MRVLRYSFFALMLCVFASCDRYDIRGFFVNPSADVEKRTKQSLEKFEANLDTLIVAPAGDSYRLYICSDIHNTGAQMHNFPYFIRQACADASTAAVIYNGDLTDYDGGLYAVCDTIKNLTTVPYRVLIGNHDVLYKQWDTFFSLYGSTVYYFVVQSGDAKDLYVCLDSANATLGKLQMQWFKDILNKKAGAFRHYVLITHVNFWDTEFSQMPSCNFMVEETAVLTGLLSKYNFEYSITGHDHTREEVSLNGVTYITLDAIKDGVSNASYFILEVGETITHQFVEL